MITFKKQLVALLKNRGTVKWKRTDDENETQFPLIVYDVLNEDSSSESDNSYQNKNAVVRISVIDETDCEVLARDIEEDIKNNFSGLNFRGFRDVTDINQDKFMYQLEMQFFNL